VNIDPLTGVIAVCVAVVIVALLCYSPPPTDIHDTGLGGDARKISSANGLGTGAGDLEIALHQSPTSWRQRKGSSMSPN
jgi:hypothetical protein